MKKTRVLIVDDSALIRQILTQLLGSDPDLEVVGTAPDPVAARAKIAALRPDVLTLDVEMPKEDGLTFLGHLMSTKPMPVVMISTLTERGGELTMRALELGAVDFVTKPKLDVQRGTVDRGAEIIAKVKAAGSARVRARPAIAALPIDRKKPPEAPILRTTQKVIVIGASTGGTEAIRDVLQQMPATSPPIVIVQHMPPGFTRQFAERLNGICRVRVREARDGDPLVNGHALIAPGGDSHLELVRSGAAYSVKLVKAPPVGHHRPSVDVMFESAARTVGPNAVAAILTGMGADGANGMLSMRKAGAKTFAEDASTCVVFGMPKEAIARGGVEHVLPLDKIAASLLRAAA